jgi:glycogen(starch) synthase
LNILVVSNLYPPYNIGGYELGCRDVVEALKRGGHRVTVLTSTYGIRKPRVDGDIWRCLHTNEAYDSRNVLTRATRPLRVFKLFGKEWTNQNAFRHAVQAVQPDLVYVWNASGISMSLILLAEEMGIPVCYFVSDEWLRRYPNQDLWFKFWGGGFLPPRLQRAIEPALGGVARALGLSTEVRGNSFRAVQFASRYLMERVLESGKTISEGSVIHWGIDDRAFPYKQQAAESPSRLLYVGRVVHNKGVHTAIEALRIVREEYGYCSATLDVVGGSIEPSYVRQQQGMVRDLGLQDAVRFRGPVAREQVPSMYDEHDVLIFPSIWPEPFSITVLEAMSSGLPVVGTATGGSAEVLEHGRNALVFPAGDANACAHQIVQLLGDTELRERLRRNGRRTIEERFRFDSMVDRIEASLAAL